MSRRRASTTVAAAWLWLGASALALVLLVMFGIPTLIIMHGLGHFWPDPLHELVYEDDTGHRTTLLGTIAGRATRTGPDGVAREPYLLVRTANRDLAAPDSRWLKEAGIVMRRQPQNAITLERTTGNRVHGYLHAGFHNGTQVARGNQTWPWARAALERTLAVRAELAALHPNLLATSRNEPGAHPSAPQRLHEPGAQTPPALPQALRIAALEPMPAATRKHLEALVAGLAEDAIRLRLADGSYQDLPLASILRMWQPNAMHLGNRLVFQMDSVSDFVSTPAGTKDTVGGIFTAIVGTVLLMLLTTLLVTPLGVVAALYLHEYAKPPAVRWLRITVRSLAGIPSIIYGVFGLGFFVYVVGGSIDELLFSHALPSPTVGAPGLLWAALTLTLLTLPVVILATEEGLARTPRELREGSLALGATHSETLWRLVLPTAAPAILTGVILAMTRAASAVAPLLLVGAVSLSPQLPLDGHFPFLHLERPFAYLGLYVYDPGLHSPSLETARPLVFATALLLLLLILGLNLLAILLRNRLHHRYGASAS